jgi:hypothetical protein
MNFGHYRRWLIRALAGFAGFAVAVVLALAASEAAARAGLGEGVAGAVLTGGLFFGSVAVILGLWMAGR